MLELYITGEKPNQNKWVLCESLEEVKKVLQTINYPHTFNVIKF